MRLRVVLPLAVAAALFVPSAASAAFSHTIAPGESLYSIAAADGLTVSQLAAANGLSSSQALVAGTAVQIPPQASSVSPSYAASSNATATVGTEHCDGDVDSDDVGCGEEASESAPASTAVPTSTSAAGGSYVVQPGDTLSAIAARAGVSAASLAAANGLSPTASWSPVLRCG